MKKLLLVLAAFCCFFLHNTQASCLPGQTELRVEIITDFWPYETTWNIKDLSGNTLAAGDSIGDTICVTSGTCVIFTIYDSFGDGIYAPGGYWVYSDGLLVANGNAFGTQASHYLNCPPGISCASSIPIQAGSYTSYSDNEYFVFTPTISGMYKVSTCLPANTCDTKLWIYSSCANIINPLDEGPPGTYAFNEDFCGVQAEILTMMIASNNYFIRVGDNMDNCADSIQFVLTYEGPVTGCMDPTACNFNPLATSDDGSCIYFPNPLCQGPDLRLDSMSLLTSMYVQTMTASMCDVDEGCVVGYGTRHVIAFTSKVDNIGPQDYYIGNPSTNPGMFNITNCHGHTHFEGYGDYRVYDMNGNLVPAGHKNGFCVMDLCGFGQYGCGDMGISAGCYDVYGAGTQCQWIDVTNLPTGDYKLVAIINSSHLPDALGHNEINFINNVTNVCFHLQNNGTMAPTFTVLPTCSPFVDCMGVPAGSAMPDCNGVCNGMSKWGDVDLSLTLDTTDISQYLAMIAGSTAAVPCNDLNADNSLTVYDAALANRCLYNGSFTQPGGASANLCLFPKNIVNPNQVVSLKAASINTTAGYIDVEIMNPTAQIQAFQFELSGLTIQSVMSITTDPNFQVQVTFNPSTSQVIGMARMNTKLAISSTFQPLVRVYYSALTSNQVCISQIIDIVNKSGERTQMVITPPCIPTLTTRVPVNTSYKASLRILPNPTESMARLYFDGFKKVPSQIGLYDVLGKKVMDLNIEARNNEWIDINLLQLETGIYFLRAQDADDLAVTVKVEKL